MRKNSAALARSLLMPPASCLMQWYDEHKSCLAQPSTPPAAPLGHLQGAAAAATTTPFAPAEQQQRQQQHAVASSLLHYRQSSRNLSFDARELAAFHRRLAQ